MMIIISITFKIYIAVQFSVATAPVYLDVRLWREVNPQISQGKAELSLSQKLDIQKSDEKLLQFRRRVWEEY